MRHWSTCQLFSNLSKQQVEKIQSCLEPITFDPGEPIMKDGDPGNFLFIVELGTVQVSKKGVNLAQCEEGDAVGLVAMIQEGKRTADVVAGQQGASGQILHRRNYRKLYEQGNLDLVNNILTNVLRLQSDTLLNSNILSAQEVHAKLAIEQKRVASARFLVNIVIGLVLFTFLLGFISSSSSINTKSPIFSTLVISALGLWAIITVNLNNLPLKTFGIRWDNFYSSLRLVIPATLAFIGGMILTKLALTRIWPETFGTEVFGFFPVRTGFSPLALAMIYSLHSIMQEFIARGCIQGGLHEFSSYPDAKWGPIVMATLMFASIHVVSNFYFAMLTIIPGLFWGYLFYKKRNIWSLSLSHIAIGLFAIFFLGLVHN